MTGLSIIETLSEHPPLSAEATHDYENLVRQYPYFGLAQFCLEASKNRPAHFLNNHTIHLYFKNSLLANIQLHNCNNYLNDSNLKFINSDSTLKDLSEAIKNKSGDSPASALPFEPLHTTDYFASQGIRLSEQPAGNDKLGKQLKSFTEWLKTMKRIKPEVLEEQAEIDPAIDQLAEISNQKSEVITEAMATLYLQQGKKALAIDVYTKLSLQNPSKKRYFADKIEQIKQS
ncbi:MAG: hypothetical protein ACKO5C_07140 [Ferruginibacter sp.]